MDDQRVVEYICKLKKLFFDHKLLYCEWSLLLYCEWSLLFVAPEVNGTAQMIVTDKGDQILPALQIMTREGRKMQIKTMSVWRIPKTRSL